MQIRLSFAALALALAATSPAFADEPRPSPLPKPARGRATVFTFGAEHPDCVEWTDACRTCARGAHGAPTCSTPGIACTPGALVCRESRKK